MMSDKATVSPAVSPVLQVLLVLVLAGVLAGPAFATREFILPTLFDVEGVAADDVLNIRAEPSAASEIIGSLPPNARDIEVTELDPSGRWARINSGERTGWVAFRYLGYQVGIWEDGRLPPALMCYGTEPFWALRPGEDVVTLSRPGSAELRLDLRTVQASPVFRDPRRVIAAGGDGRALTAFVTPQLCSDGMSDQLFGLETAVLLEEDGETQLLLGCCSIAP